MFWKRVVRRGDPKRLLDKVTTLNLITDLALLFIYRAALSPKSAKMKLDPKVSRDKSENEQND